MKTFAIFLAVMALLLFTSIDMNKTDRMRLDLMEEDIIKSTKVLDSLLLEGIRLEDKIDSLAYILQDKEIELTLKNK